MDVYLIDTNIIGWWYNPHKREHENVKKHIDSLELEDENKLWVSAITLGEIEYGHRLNPKRDLAAQKEFLDFVHDEIPHVVDITKHTVPHYGQLRANLFNKFAGGKRKRWPEELTDPITAKELGIQENDLWIAAQAIQYDVVLVTNDKMNRIRAVTPELRVEDWAAAPTTP